MHVAHICINSWLVETNKHQAPLTGRHFKKELMGRAPCCDKGNVKRGPWSPEEDATLKSYIQLHGTGGNWIALPHKIGLNRCGKSCRLRWLNYLRPNIKHGGFSDEEDDIICTLYMTIGSRWSIIAAQLPGRTDNDIKNYWNTKLKKKLMSKHRKDVVSKQQAMINIENFMANSYKFWQPDDQLPTSISSFIVNDNPANYQEPLNDPNQLVYDIDNAMNIYNIPNIASSLASVDNNATSFQVPDNYCQTDLEAFNNLVIDQLHEMAYGFMETSTNLCGSMNSTSTAQSTACQY